MDEYKQGVTTYGLPFRLIDADDETQVVTGASPSVAICKSGQTAFSTGGGSVTELADGAYRYDWAAADLNTLGPLLVKITATGAVTLMGRVKVVSHDPLLLLGPTAAGRTLSVAADGGVPLSSLENGQNLTQIPWNAAWDAEVQSEAADALAGTEILLSADAITAMAQGVRTELTVELGRIDAPISESTLSQEAIDDIIDGINEALVAVSPDVVTANRTWVAQEYRATNIVEVGDNFAGTLALKPDLNPGTTISTVDSVSITGAATVTATDLTVDRSKTIAHFTVPALATTGTYTVVVTVTTVDGQTIPTTATLKVY